MLVGLSVLHTVTRGPMVGMTLVTVLTTAWPHLKQVMVSRVDLTLLGDLIELCILLVKSVMIRGGISVLAGLRFMMSGPRAPLTVLTR